MRSTNRDASRRVLLTFLSICGLALATSTVVAAEWFRQFGTSENDVGEAVASDEFGNVYVIGQTEGDLGAPYLGNLDVFVSKHDVAGNHLWTRQFGTSGADGTAVSGVQVNGFGQVFVTGETTGDLGGPNQGGFDVFVAAFDTNGDSLWKRQLGTSFSDQSAGISADHLGNVYLAGTTGGSIGGPNHGGGDAFLAKYDTVGDLLWARQIGSSTFDAATGVSADNLGNVYLLGTTGGTLNVPTTGSGRNFLFKYDPSGNLQWTKQFNASGNGTRDVVADGLGNVYVAAESNQIFKFDENGDLLWTRDVFLNQMADLTSDDLGNVYLAGYTSFGSTDLDVVVFQFNAEGTQRGQRRFGSSGDDYGFGISADAQGNVFLTGRTDGALGGPNAGGNDVFLAKIEEFEFVVVPEPTSSLLAMIALAVTYGLSRKQTKSQLRLTGVRDAR